jgi:hypothetical protein
MIGDASHPISDVFLGQLTTFLDDLRVNDPDTAEVLWKLGQEKGGTAWNDQADAAGGEALQIATAIAELVSPAGSVHAAAQAVADTPEWVRLGMLDTQLAWLAGLARTCMHDPHSDRPEPVFAAAWKPRLVVCSGCRHLLDAVASEAICDGCGRDTTGEGISTTTVMPGNGLCYLVGTCEDCTRDLRRGAVDVETPRPGS